MVNMAVFILGDKRPPFPYPGIYPQNLSIISAALNFKGF